MLAGERGGPNKGRKLVLFRHVAGKRESELEDGRKVRGREDRAEGGKEERNGRTAAREET